jgi:CRISPR-associated endonuclease/helicase Cas3
MLQKRIGSLRKAWGKAELEGRLSEEPAVKLLLLRGGKVVERGRIERETAVLGKEPFDDIKRIVDRLNRATLLIEPAVGGLDDRGALADQGERPSEMHVEPNMLIRLVPRHGDEGQVPRLLALSDRLRRGNPDLRLPPVSKDDAREAHPRGLRPVWTARLPAPAGDEDANEDVLEYWSARWSFDGETAASKREQSLTEHHQWAAAEMLLTAERVGLPATLTECLVRAIALHDHGKDRRAWRRAAGAPLSGEALAKTRSTRMGDLGGYRHEFGSLRDALDSSRYRAELEVLGHDLRELALHLIAAHHGRARPSIAAIDEEEIFADVLAEDALEAGLRYARLQRAWGPWGLAWLEALLRAADARASRRLEGESPTTSEAPAEAAT